MKKHPLATKIDVEESPNVIGSVWRRREPAGDDFDDVVIRGVLDLGADTPGGGLELVVSPVAFGPALSTTVESFTEAYTRANDGDETTKQLTERLQRLETRG